MNEITLRQITYKLRAECLDDLVWLTNKLNENGYLISYRVEKLSISPILPDATLQIKLQGVSLPMLKKIISGRLDSHVMAETVALLRDYTGERK